MAKTRDYMDYLDETVDIAPANSQEEYQAAQTIADVLRDHELETSVEEFDAYPWATLVSPITALLLLVFLLVGGLTQGAIHIVFLILSAALVGVTLFMHYSGTNLFEMVGPASKSQNVVAVHRASGDKVVKGARPIVVVAHYDTPRQSFLYSSPLARYQATLRGLTIPCYIAVGVSILIQIMGFLPSILRTIMLVVGIIALLPMVLLAIADLQSRFAPCTLGANDNKSSVAALLALANKVRPMEDRVSEEGSEGGEERTARRAPRRAGDEPEPAPAPRRKEVVEDVYGVRHGREALLSLGILPPSCEIVYQEPRVLVVEDEPIAPQSNEEPQQESTEDAGGATAGVAAAAGVAAVAGALASNASEDDQTQEDEQPKSLDDDLEPMAKSDDDRDADSEEAEETPARPRRTVSSPLPPLEDDEYEEDEEDDRRGAREDSHEGGRTRRRSERDDDEYEDEYDDEYEDEYDEEYGDDEDYEEDWEDRPSVGTWFKGVVSNIRDRFGKGRSQDEEAEPEDEDVEEEYDEEYDEYEEYGDDEYDEEEYDDERDEATDEEPADDNADQEDDESDDQTEDEEEPVVEKSLKNKIPVVPAIGDDQASEDEDLVQGEKEADDQAEDKAEAEIQDEGQDVADGQADKKDDDEPETQDESDDQVNLNIDEKTEADDASVVEEAKSEGEPEAEEESIDEDAAEDDRASSDDGYEYDEYDEDDGYEYEDEYDEDEGYDEDEEEEYEEEPEEETPRRSFLQRILPHVKRVEEEPEEEEEYAEDDEEQYEDEEYADDGYQDDEYVDDQEYDDDREYVDEDEEYEDDGSDYDSQPEDDEYEDDDVRYEDEDEYQDDGQEAEGEDVEYDDEYARPTIGQRISGFFSKIRMNDAPAEDDDYEAFEGELGNQVEQREEEVFEEAYDEGDFYEDDYDYEDEPEPEPEPYVERSRFQRVQREAPAREVYDDTPAESREEVPEPERMATPVPAPEYVAPERNDMEQDSRGENPYVGGFVDVELDFDDETEQAPQPAAQQVAEEPARTAQPVQQPMQTAQPAREQDAPALSDPNLLHFDRVEDEDVAARDTSGLDKISDSYDLYSMQDVPRQERTRPEPMGDPSWGVSSYQPARPALNIARRAALFDIPDPSSITVDPFNNDYDDYDDDYEYDDYGYEDTQDDGVVEQQVEDKPQTAEVQTEAPEPVEVQPAEPESPVVEDTKEDAQPDDSANSQRSQDQGSSQKSFWGSDSARKSDWKGGATVRQDLLENEDEPLIIDEQDLQDAIVELGDEYLVSHDIWFVATGASEVDHAGIRAFIDEHRRDIRGAFLINLDSVGAGSLSVLVREGLHAPRRADRRLVRMITGIAQDLHIQLGTALFNWGERDSATAMRSRVRAVSIVGLDDNNMPAYSHTPDDVPENVDPRQVSNVVRIVTELIRRS
ncbi:MAG: M28 family peptidase [Atopobiaceae bacterium]|nr:M28 family peptidase [Atopobiaceae bacterium]